MRNSSDYLGIRINKELYEDFKQYCKGREISVAFAMELLADECIKRKKAPFPLGVTNDANLKYSGNESRQSLILEKNKKELFQIICENDIGLKMSNVVKAYMIYCVTYRPKLPYSFDKN